MDWNAGFFTADRDELYLAAQWTPLININAHNEEELNKSDWKFQDIKRVTDTSYHSAIRYTNTKKRKRNQKKSKEIKRNQNEIKMK